MCQGEAPDVFGFDEDADQATVLIAEPGPELYDAVRRAQKFCPAMAIEITQA
jgi:ferredoxin